MRVLNIAPFARDESFGGSQRATVVAERLEERGASVAWAALPPRIPGRTRRLLETLAREPAAVRHARRADDPPGGSFDVALAAHSYMAPKLSHVPLEAVRVVDFHNLEWRHLQDVERFAGPARRVHLRAQVARLRRFERDLVRACQLTIFATPAEAEWADSVGRGGKHLVVPNLLPRAEVAAAAETWERRRTGSRDDLLLYVGKLTFPPNVLSLERFLRETWPTVLAANPQTVLRAVGACSDDVRRRLAAHPGVEATGFLADLRPSLAEAAVAILPFDGSAGSSLRVLLFALAGLPAVGSPGAFRGVAPDLGTVASTPTEWADAIAHIRSHGSSGSAARDAARALHRDPEPWDALMAELRRLVAGPERRSDPLPA